MTTLLPSIQDFAAPRTSSSSDATIAGGPPKYYPQLDAVRGIACLLVLAAHLHGVRGLSFIPESIGVAGVALFFALSGFLITRGLLADRKKAGGLNRFYNRRAPRIFPIYFLTLAVLALTWPGKELGWAAIFAFNFLYVSGTRAYFNIDAGETPIPPVGHMWSLCVEEHFYWFWPAIVALLPMRLLRWIPLLCIAATPFIIHATTAMLVMQNFQREEINGLISRMTWTQLTAISIGALLAIHETRLLSKARIGGFNFVPAPLIATLGVIGSIGLWAYLEQGTEILRDVQPMMLHLLCGSLFAITLSWAWLGRIVALRYVGRISYGAYLYHLPIYAALGLATRGAAAPPWRGGLALALTLGAAAISYRFIESPILEFVRARDKKFLVRAGRVKLSIGSLLTIALALAAGWRIGAWIGGHTIIPKAWRHENLNVPGATSAYRWHGVVHVIGPEGYRRTTPFPAKTPGIPRIAVVGNSYVYGLCVPEDQVLSAVLEQSLAKSGIRVESLNMGQFGYHVEDVRDLVRNKLPAMHPDVVIYAAVSNDYLPRSQDWNGRTLADFREKPEYANRFSAAVQAMRDDCQNHGILFRVVVFMQSPDTDEEVKLARFTESLLARSNVQFITIESYLKANEGRSLRTSCWDWHPNTACHRFYAEMVAAELVRLKQQKQWPRN